MPVLEDLLEQYPFRILGFHADNGSEFINHRVAGLLNRRLVEFTKSRPYRSNDNALVEGKNGAIIRKHIGYGHLPAGAAPALAQFYRDHLNPYLNFHRPCGFATVTTDARGRRRRRYPAQDYATPFERFCQLPEAARFLRPGLTLASLQRTAAAASDIQAACQLQAAKARLRAVLDPVRWK